MSVLNGSNLEQNRPKAKLIGQTDSLTGIAAFLEKKAYAIDAKMD